MLRLRVADRLFGTSELAPAAARRWGWRYLALTAALAAIIVARRPDAVTMPQFWGEDGYVFFYENLTLGFARALAKMYQGFPYLTHRLIAFAGGLTSFELAPRIYTSSAILLTALGAATFALPGFRHLVRNDALRMLFGVAVVSAPFDQEVLGTPTNLGWFLGTWLFLLSLVRLPQGRWRMAMLAAGGAVLVVSTPLAAVSLPLWLLRAWHAARRGLRGEMVWSLVLVVMFVVVLLATRRLGAGAKGLAISDMPAEYLRHCVGLMSYRAVALLLPPAASARLLAEGLPALAAAAALLLGTLLGLSAVARFRTLPALLVATYGFVAFFVLLVVGRPQVVVLGSWAGLPFRYTIFPAAMFALALVAALDGLPGRIRHLGTVGVALLLAAAWGPRFVVPPFRDLDWPRWASALARKRESGSRDELRIPMNPRWAPLVFDRVAIAPDANVPSGAIVAGLGTHGTFRQLFHARCAGLAAVRIHLAAEARSAEGEVALSLFAGRTPIARRQIPRAEIEPRGSWQTISFAPIAESAGQPFTIVVQAVGNLVDATVYVLGAQGDPYPDGTATLGNTVVAGDAAFRYGCAPAPLAG